MCNVAVLWNLSVGNALAKQTLSGGIFYNHPYILTPRHAK